MKIIIRRSLKRSVNLIMINLFEEYTKIDVQTYGAYCIEERQLQLTFSYIKVPFVSWD